LLVPYSPPVRDGLEFEHFYAGRRDGDEVIIVVGYLELFLGLVLSWKSEGST
jgi:hypothetical protein